MKAGEWQGADRRVYKWAPYGRGGDDGCGAEEGYYPTTKSDGYTSWVRPTDLRAAAAALVALADERETVYVELTEHERLVVRGDGITMEARLGVGLKWGPVLHPNTLVIAAFRAGQDRGKA